MAPWTVSSICGLQLAGLHFVSMSKASQAPATKADITMLMGEIGKLYDANERWKEELKRHFDIKVETIRHDLLGANKDRIENHEQRIARLEQGVGFSPA
jgi:hypothetical protein